ncbi:subclass B1 metallo-beta-lactamase [Marinilabilia salmonicolor]|uniref:subclass B1 metallo-beta-lactamase n=1 Tax=Marinilabilia salmonicolor TaxID=989 RepID=UPI00029AD797|nr:subclass B1 metallo-beta-lactamase [Marinilabilia salmonicolor]
MKGNKRLFVLLIGLLGLCQIHAKQPKTIVVNNDIQLFQLADSVYVHVTWHQSDEFGRFPSNGMLVVRNGEALMVDTPMDDGKTEKLTRYLKDSMSVDISKVIVGHFHDDCLGGLGYLHNLGIESLANFMTIEKCKELNLPVPSTPFSDSLTIDFNGEPIICRYFGAGHSFDNITVWLPEKRILFGGCLVKSMGSRGLGNLADAVVEEWDKTVGKVLAAYPEAEIVIPGHGSWGNKELLTHTIKLAKGHKRNLNLSNEE